MYPVPLPRTGSPVCLSSLVSPVPAPRTNPLVCLPSLVRPGAVLSHPDLRDPFMPLFCFGQGVSWGGHSMFCVSMIFYFYVLPGMVLNQGQLSIVVSDWEPYLGCLFSHLSLWEVDFLYGT